MRAEKMVEFQMPFAGTFCNCVCVYTALFCVTHECSIVFLSLSGFKVKMPEVCCGCVSAVDNDPPQPQPYNPISNNNNVVETLSLIHI